MHQDSDDAAASPDGHDCQQLLNQTHAHGSETETGGVLSDLDIGGGILDGCTTFACFEGSAEGTSQEVQGGVEVVSVRRLSDGSTEVTLGLVDLN